MAQLEIDHLHTDYYVDSVDTARELEQVMAAVVSSTLDVELLGSPLTSAHAVCLPDVRVRLDASTMTSRDDLAHQWAQVMIDAVRVEIRAGRSPVVYPREADALVDALRSLAIGDTRRAWAWRRVGIVPESRGGEPVVADGVTALAARPQWIPATLYAIGPARELLVAEHWIALAQAFLAAPAGAVARAAFVQAQAVPGASNPPSAIPPTVADAMALVAPPVWAALAGSERRLVGALVLACTAPTAGRNPAVLTALDAHIESLGHATRRRGGSARPEPDDVTLPRPIQEETLPASPGPPSDSSPGTDPASKRALAEGFPDHTRPDLSTAGTDSDVAAIDGIGGRAQVADSEAPYAPEPPEEAVSPHGGLFYLIHAITALDPFEDVPAANDPAELIARTLARVADAPLNDPAVLVASGWTEEAADAAVDPTPGGDLDRAVRTLTDRTVAWVVGRLSEPLDIREIVMRTATVVRERGWIEATFAIETVDIRIRTGGLDLDPGFVWWLGAVVRFRYV